MEARYLVHDNFVLILAARRHGESKASDKALLTHHIGISSALLVLHYYIAHGREAGICVNVMFMLMNSTTPILNLRWYFRTLVSKERGATLAAAGPES